MTRILKTVFYVFFFLLIILPFPVRAEQNPQEQLKQLMADIQKNPGDYALREKIIKVVQEMKPQPVVPEEAQRHLGRGSAAVEIAKTSEDFLLAISEFKKALHLAPWLANAYFNLAVVQEKVGQFNEAIQNFKLYLLAAPSAADAQDVKTRIYGLELKAELKGKEEKEKSTHEEREKQKQEVLNRFKQMVEGNIYELFVCNKKPYAGCNENEYNEKNWYDSLADAKKADGADSYVENYSSFHVTSDWKILLCNYGGGGHDPDPLCPGGVRGFRYLIGEVDETGSIRWTNDTWISSKGKPVPVWVRYNADYSSFTISHDRPADDKGYDPSIRYNYQSFRPR